MRSINRDLELQELTRQYKVIMGVSNWTSQEVADWAIETGHIIPPKPSDPKLILARQISDAMRREMVTDVHGHRVRVIHSITEMQEGKSVTHWCHVSELTPEKARISAVQRRNGCAADIKQMKFDFDYYNENYNPGEPIMIPLDFTQDVEEDLLADSKVL